MNTDLIEIAKLLEYLGYASESQGVLAANKRIEELEKELSWHRKNYVEAKDIQRENKRLDAALKFIAEGGPWDEESIRQFAKKTRAGE